MEYKIVLESFEGPLDLLLKLISKTKIDIYDIPIHLITKQYMDYIYNMERMNLEIASDFLVMASTLIEIKSKMLLPKEKVLFEDEEFDVDPRDELVRRILEYKKFKEAAEELKEFEKEKAKTYYKPKEDLSIYEDGIIDFESFDVDLLIKSLNSMLSKRGMIEENIDVIQISRDEYTISECMNNIFDKLRKTNQIKFSELIDFNSKKNEIIAYFLSLLEMIKTKDVLVKQEHIFSDLTIVRITAEEN